MTLIVSLGNEEQVVQLSDRTLSANGRIMDKESNKVGSLVCADARMLYGYTGLAKNNKFETDTWILDALTKSGPPDYLANNILERFKTEATNRFKTDPSIFNLRPEEKRISILFTGYLYPYNPHPPLVYTLVTNYQDTVSGKDSPVAWDEFKTLYAWQRKPNTTNLSLVQRIGFWQQMTSKHVDSLKQLLLYKKPTQALIGKGIDILREISKNSNGIVGPQISALILPRDPSRSITGSYHTSELKHSYYIPNRIVLLPQHHIAIKGMEVSPEHPDSSNYISIPKVGPNIPCPCGSGKKYKKCHGNNK